jgi:amidohydrolase
MKLISSCLVLFFVLSSIAPVCLTTKASRALTHEQAIAQKAEALRDKLVTQRRDFHQYPELSNREERTAKVIAEKLKAIGLEDIKINVARHGVTALLKGKKPGPVVAVRADMDALPIQETINVPYKSKNDGVKHACGHDAHMTIQLGVAEILNSMRDEIQGTIKFIFQPAEEGPPAGEEGGAKLMIKEGIFENPRPQAIFGLHVMPKRTGRTSGLQFRSRNGFIGQIQNHHSRQKGSRRLPARRR